MPSVSIEHLAAEIFQVATTPASTVFAGAGVGMRAGLPDWRQFVRYLANSVEPYDPDSAALMRKRLASNLFLNAADLYRECPLMPLGVKLQKLGEPFSANSYNPKALRALLALPFDSFVTTNFDRSLHDAFALARQGSPVCAELGDPSLRQAIYNWKDPYIARIHGRAEVPATMVLDKAGYQRTEADDSYLEFLIHILTTRRCFFVGYSFVDPAIHRVLDVLDARVAPHFPVEHLAIVPESGSELVVRLARYNIRVLTYDDSNGHEDPWRAIRKALSTYRSGSAKPPRSCPQPLEAAHRLLASSYARAEMSNQAAPVRVVVLEGIILGIAVDQPGLTRLEVADRLRRLVPMTSKEAEQVIHPAVDRLVKDLVVEERDRQLHVVKQPPNAIDVDLQELSSGLSDRMLVRHGIKLLQEESMAVRRIVEHLVLSRGWDLAAMLASAKRSDLFDLHKPLDTALASFGKEIGWSKHDALREALQDLLERPNSREATILTKLARLAFGVDVALEVGRSTFIHSLTLPERIYLDASVLLPAITPGHPYRPSYIAAIRSLQDAATRAGISSQVIVLEPFLNEVVSHRSNALRLVERGRLENPDRLLRFIELTGADYTNVYVGGYSSEVGQLDEPISFSQYLTNVAPYSTEPDLAAFLKTHGIITASADPADSKERDLYIQVQMALNHAYEHDAHSRRESKPEVLIRHEAQQLARLLRELDGGTRSVFVTADSRLRRLAKGDTLGRVSPALFSHTGLLQLVDLLIGLDAEEESLSRLLWAIEARDDRDALRGYFIDLALRRYDAALAMSMPQLVEQVVDRAAHAAERDGVQFAFFRDGSDIERTFDFLDKFEEEFYALMAAELKEREEMP